MDLISVDFPAPFGPIGQALTPDALKATYGGTALVLAGGSTIITAS